MLQVRAPIYFDRETMQFSTTPWFRAPVLIIIIANFLSTKIFIANSVAFDLGIFLQPHALSDIFANTMLSILSLIATSYKIHESTSSFPTFYFFMQIVASVPVEPDANLMPSENSFKQHVERVRVSLTNFNAIRKLDAPGPIKTAMDELIALALDFSRYTTFFAAHALFLEIVPATFQALEDCYTKHPSFEKTDEYKQIIGLNARAAKEVAAQATATKRCMFLFCLSFYYGILILSLFTF